MNTNRMQTIVQAKRQQGIMLIEGLLAILIFSLGVLAMVGMQAQSIAHTSQAKYRIDASFLANKLIAQMWADAPGNRPSYATGGLRFNDWKTREVDAYLPPGRSSAFVTVTPVANTVLVQLINPTPPPTFGHRVTVRIEWRAPNEANSVPAHVYTTSTDIIS